MRFQPSPINVTASNIRPCSTFGCGQVRLSTKQKRVERGAVALQPPRNARLIIARVRPKLKFHTKFRATSVSATHVPMFARSAPPRSPNCRRRTRQPPQQVARSVHPLPAHPSGCPSAFSRHPSKTLPHCGNLCRRRMPEKRREKV